jgi:hypothetical protein
MATFSIKLGMATFSIKLGMATLESLEWQRAARLACRECGVWAGSG